MEQARTRTSCDHTGREERRTRPDALSDVRICGLRQYLSTAWSDGIERMAGMLKSADDINDQTAGERAQHIIKTHRLVKTKRELAERPVKEPGPV